MTYNVFSGTLHPTQLISSFMSHSQQISCSKASIQQIVRVLVTCLMCQSKSCSALARWSELLTWLSVKWSDSLKIKTYSQCIVLLLEWYDGNFGSFWWLDGISTTRQVWNVLHAARWTCRTQKSSKKIATWAPSQNFIELYLRNCGTYRQSEKTC